MSEESIVGVQCIYREELIVHNNVPNCECILLP